MPEALALIAEHALSHLPVLDGDRVIGLFSHSDLLQEMVAHQKRVLDAIALDQIVLHARGTYSC